MKSAPKLKEGRHHAWRTPYGFAHSTGAEVTLLCTDERRGYVYIQVESIKKRVCIRVTKAGNISIGPQESIDDERKQK